MNHNAYDRWKREVHRFASEADWLDARLRDLTSTECAALFGKSKYLTPYKLWYVKKNGIMKHGRNSERMEWGIRLQDAIAKGIADDHGFNITKMDEYIRIPELRMASSFDFRIGDDTLLEIKNVGSDSFKQWWVFDDDTAAAPPHIELQVQHQLAVSGFRLAYIGALIGGNKPILLRRERNEKLIAEIFERVAEFWASVDTGRAPEPDLEVDSANISEIYRLAVPGTVMEADDQIDDLIAQYRKLQESSSNIERAKDQVRAQLLMKIGDVERVRGSTYSINASTVKEKPISYVRSSYRQFKVSYKKDLDSGEKNQ